MKPIKLEPNPNCKICLGKGYIRTIRPGLDANIYRELRPCPCVKKVVKASDLEEARASEHVVV